MLNIKQVQYPDRKCAVQLEQVDYQQFKTPLNKLLHTTQRKQTAFGHLPNAYSFIDRAFKTVRNTWRIARRLHCKFSLIIIIECNVIRYLFALYIHLPACHTPNAAYTCDMNMNPLFGARSCDCCITFRQWSRLISLPAKCILLGKCLYTPN